MIFPRPSTIQCIKLFSPRNYPSDNNDQITNTKLWLERILLNFQYTKEVIDICKGESLEFTETPQHECENKMIFKALRICGSNLQCHKNWPKLMQLWRKIIFIPSSIGIFKRGFPNKSHLRNRATIFNIWRNMRD